MANNASMSFLEAVDEYFDMLIKSRFIEMFKPYYEDMTTYRELKSVCFQGPQNGLYKKQYAGTIRANIAKMSQAYGGGCIDYQLKYENILIDESEQRFLLNPGDLVFGRTSLVPGGAGDNSWVGELHEPTVFKLGDMRVGTVGAYVF